MSLVTRKNILYGVAANAVNAQVIQATNTATNYTPTAVGSEATTEVSAHLNGINTALGTATTSGDIAVTSFSAANNQNSAANVTGLAFANGSIRAFSAQVSVTVIATSSLYENFTLNGIQRGADWQMSSTSVGDSSGFVFTITSAGQVQYTDNNYSGFTSATLKFRAKILPV